MRPSTLTIGGVALGALLVGVAARLARYGGFDLITEHLVGYPSHGVVRRGLLGTLTGPWIASRTDVLVSMAVLTLVGGTVLCVLLVRLASRLDDEQAWFVLPATATVFVQLGWDLGRVDVLVLVVLVGLWLAVERGASPATTTALLCVGGLVHEMTLLWGGALLVGAAAAGRVDLRDLLPPAVGASVLGVLLLVLGDFPGSPAEFAAAMPHRPSGGVDDAVARSAAWTGDLTSGMASIRPWAAAVGPLHVAVLPITALVCARALHRAIGPVPAVASVAAAALLALVGIDHLRWAFLLAVVTILQLAHARALPAMTTRTAFAGVAALAVVGAWGHTTAFPHWLVV